MHKFESWPALSYHDFKDTAYLLHRIVQLVGKLKLYTPFEPHWANVPLWVTSRGLTTGPIPYQSDSLTIYLDFIAHAMIFVTSRGKEKTLKLTHTSVAEFTQLFLTTLHHLGIDLTINLMPQEIPNAIAMDQDTQARPYEKELANAWWRIVHSSFLVLQQYHARFKGITPRVGFMWGTFDLRDARYNGIAVPITKENSDYIRRNAMDEGQIEAGWWSGNDLYQKPAYYSFAFPAPANIEQAKINPATAHWEKPLGEFVLDYDDIRHSKHPESDLLAFFESTYQAGAKLAKWDPQWQASGHPI